MARLEIMGAAVPDDERWNRALQEARRQTETAQGSVPGTDLTTAGGLVVVIVNQTLIGRAAIKLLRRLRRAKQVIVIVNGAMSATSDLATPDPTPDPAPALRACACEPAGQEPPSYAATRWADAVVRLALAPRDPRTLEEWGREIGVSSGALRNWCRAAHLSPRRSLLLGRLLRAVHLARGRSWHPERLLNVTDPRTLHKVLALGGLPRSAETVTISDLLTRQCLIQDDTATRALSLALSRSLSSTAAP